jgi:hypothetical protein
MAFDSSTKPRAAWATLALACLLAAAVGGAWLVVRYYRTSAQEGAAMLDDMRKRTLADFWTGEAYQAKYVIRDSAGRVMGYETVLRGPLDDGFGGVTVHQGGNFVMRETWWVANDLSKGHYEANYLSRNGQAAEMHISLDGGRVGFWASGMNEEDSEEAHANYLPEGLEPLAIRLVAREGKKATFLCIPNEESQAAMGIVLGRLTMTPRGGGAVRVRREFRSGSFTDMVYLDEHGEISRVQRIGGQVVTRIDEE